jgi:hypothetical protein
MIWRSYFLVETTEARRSNAGPYSKKRVPLMLQSGQRHQR